MRALHALRTKETLSPEQRHFAGSAFDQHYDELTASGAELITYRVDALAPPVLNARLGRIMLEQFMTPEAALYLAEQVDGNQRHNIVIPWDIAPEHIAVVDRQPFISKDLENRGVRTIPHWTTSIA